jgi:hypothetical protein
MNEPKDILPPGVILLSQPEQLRITLKEMVNALPGPLRALPHPSVVLDMEAVAQQAIQTQDWGTAQRTLEERFHAEIASLRREHPDYRIIYFGSAPIPLTVHLGFLLETWQQVMIIPHHHTRRVWGWAPDPGKPPARLLPPQFPTEKDRTPGEAIIRVSTSHLVDPSATRKVVPGSLVEIDLALEHPSEDAFSSVEEMLEVARAFRQALDLIGDRFQGIHCVHLFASVQPGMALLLGAQISKTMHPPVQTYQYARHAENGPYHVPAVLVNRPPRSEPAPLTPKQEEQAASDRACLAKDLERMEGLAEASKRGSAQGWLAGLLSTPNEHPDFRGHWRHLPALHSTPLLKTRVDTETRNIADSFRLAPPDNLWQLDEHWLARLASRLPEDTKRQQALRMLVFHELAHRGPQKLTRTSSREIGRFPRVLEEIDYQADVWTMLHEYVLARSHSPREVKDLPRFFMETVRIATETMWAFDDEGPPLREIQIRRFNRYLIWSWQYLLLERLDGQSAEVTLDNILCILAQRPNIELAGPPIHTHDGRIFFNLDAARVKDPELAVYHEGQLFRSGPRPDFRIDDLLAGVRERDGQKLREALRGAFEMTVR